MTSKPSWFGSSSAPADLAPRVWRCPHCGDEFRVIDRSRPDGLRNFWLEVRELTDNMTGHLALAHGVVLP